MARNQAYKDSHLKNCDIGVYITTESDVLKRVQQVCLKGVEFVVQMSKELSNSSMNGADWYDATLKMSLGADAISSEGQGQHRWKRVTWEKAKKDFGIVLSRKKRCDLTTHVSNGISHKCPYLLV